MNYHMKITEIPEEFMLTPADIRYAKHTQLAELTGFDPSYFSAWSSSRRISEKNLSVIAERLNLTKPQVLEGLELRRQDVAIARRVHDKLDRVIALLGSAA